MIRTNRHTDTRQHICNHGEPSVTMVSIWSSDGPESGVANVSGFVCKQTCFQILVILMSSLCVRSMSLGRQREDRERKRREMKRKRNREDEERTWREIMKRGNEEEMKTWKWREEMKTEDDESRWKEQMKSKGDEEREQRRWRKRAKEMKSKGKEEMKRGGCSPQPSPRPSFPVRDGPQVETSLISTVYCVLSLHGYHGSRWLH